MVYRGKPSTGCAKCRQRKIKCDERPEGCVNCAEKGYKCPGYEDRTDMMFRDESATVEEKAIKAKAKAIARRDERYSKSKSRSQSSTPSLDAQVVPTLDERGMGFFLTHYSCGIEGSIGPGHDVNSYLKDYNLESTVSVCMSAVGLAGIASFSRDPGLLTHAKQRYLKAIQLTNASLGSPSEVKNDSTLLSSMLLAVFETVTGTSQHDSFQAWSRHVDGSAMLLKIRGREQFSTHPGRRMYIQVASNLMMNCISNNKLVPDYIMDLNKELTKIAVPDDPTHRYYSICVEYVNFAAEIRNGLFPNLEDILQRALTLDEITKGIFENRSPSWDYDVVQVPYGTPGVFLDHFHIHGTYLSTMIWTYMRVMRIYLNEIIRNTILTGFASKPPAFIGSKYMEMYDQTTRILYQMQSEIIASAPQWLHRTPPSPPTSGTIMSSPEPMSGTSPTPTTPPPHGPKFLWSNYRGNMMIPFRTPAASSTRLPLIRLSGGFVLCWAIYMAGATSVATPEVQQYVLETLKEMSEVMGINQARILAGGLRQKMQLDREGGGEKIVIVPRYLPLRGGGRV